MNTNAHVKLERWLRQGSRLGASHVILVWDEYYDNNFPVFVMPDQNPKKIATLYDGNGFQIVTKTYPLAGLFTNQMQKKSPANITD